MPCQGGSRAAPADAPPLPFLPRKRGEGGARAENERTAMPDDPGSNDERPCLHCLIADVIDDFYAEYGSLSGEKDVIDMDEIISALGKTVAEMTHGSDAAVRRRVLEDLTREIAHFEEEYANSPASDVRH